MSSTTEFLDQVDSDLKRLCSQIKHSYEYCISFLNKNTSFIDVEFLKFKDDAFSTFKNSKALHEKQSGCQLKILHTNGRREYIGEFNDYLKKNSIAHEVIAPYSFKQNKKAKRVNCRIIGSIRAIFAQQKLFKSL